MTAPQISCTQCGTVCESIQRTCFACHFSLEPPSEEEMLAPALLSGRYLLAECVGQGGFGTVYKALDVQENYRPVALKAIALDGLSVQQRIEATDSFNREIMTLSALAHPHLPRLCDHFTDSGHWYLVMDFIEGETLQTYLHTRQEHRKQNMERYGLLPMDEVLAIALQLCDVLDYLHTRQPAIIFRDLKPENIMRTATGHLYLIDFGIARRFQTGKAHDTMPLGSPGYAAPEQYGRAQTTTRSDIYSLGALLHSLLTGDDPSEHPFHFAPLSALSPQWAALSPLIVKMLEMEADKRPASIHAIRQELQCLATACYTLSPAHSHLLLAHLGADTPCTAPSEFDQTGKLPVGIPSPRPWSRGSISRRTLLIGLAALGVSGTVGGTALVRGSAQSVPTIIRTPSHGNYGENPKEDIYAVAWSPDGKRIAAGGNDTLIQVWDVRTKAMLCSLRPQTSRILVTASTVAWSPDGTSLASGFSDNTIWVWDVARKRALYQKYCQALGPRTEILGINAVAWSPDGRRLAVAATNAMVQIRDASTGNLLVSCADDLGSYDDVVWSPNGKYVASGSDAGIAKIWDAATGKEVFAYTKHVSWWSSVQLTTLAWSPDGTRIASGGMNTNIQVWNVSSGECLVEYTGHENADTSVTCLAWSADGKKIASCAGKEVRIWDASSGATRVIYRGSPSYVQTLAWSPREDLIVSGGYEGSVQVWSPSS